MTEDKNSNRKKDFTWVFLALPLLMLGWVFLAKVIPMLTSSQNPNQQRQRLVDKKIDHHLRRGDNLSKLKTLKQEVENEDSTTRLEPEAGHLTVPEYSYGIDLKTQKTGDAVYGDLSDPESYSNSAEDDVHRRIERQRWEEQYDKVQERAFIKSFLKNAADSGYEVQLNKNLDVVDMRPRTDIKQPIRIPQSQNKKMGRGASQ